MRNHNSPGHGLAPVILMLLAAATGPIARAGTIAFNLSITGDVSTGSQPSPSNPVVSETFTGLGSFSHFGPAAYSDEGTITFGFFSSGFGVMSVASNFIVSFNGGADTFFGTSLDTFTAPDETGGQVNTGALAILGGTGIFEGATGFANTLGLTSPPPQPISFSGTGQITAAALAPEPGSLVLLALGFAGLAGAAARRKRREVCASRNRFI